MIGHMRPDDPPRYLWAAVDRDGGDIAFGTADTYEEAERAALFYEDDPRFGSIEISLGGGAVVSKYRIESGHYRGQIGPSFWYIEVLRGSEWDSAEFTPKGYLKTYNSLEAAKRALKKLEESGDPEQRGA